MRLLLPASSGISGRFHRQKRKDNNDDHQSVDWDEAGGFHVTPTCRSSNTRKSWRHPTPLRLFTPKSFVSDSSRRKTLSKQASTLTFQNQPSQSSRRRRQPDTQQNDSSRHVVQLRSRRAIVEQIPAEMQVRLVYGGDAATVTTCTTAGRSSAKIEPDEQTKRAMANIILRQFLDRDERIKLSQRQPEPEPEAPLHSSALSGSEDPHDEDIEKKKTEETPDCDIFRGVDVVGGMDTWFSCCAGLYPDSTAPDVPAVPAAPAVPASPTSTIDQTTVTNSSENSSWWSFSYQSSGISSTSSW